MELITLSEPPIDCRQCRHYFFRPRGPFSHGCLALDYIGRQPAAEMVLKAEDGPCPLFIPAAKATS